MGVVPQQQLQGMNARGKFHHGLGLAAAEVLHARAHGHAHIGDIAIDEQVVMAGIFTHRARGGDAHAAETETHGDGAFDGGAVLGGDDVSPGSVRGRSRRSGAGCGA